MTFEHLRRRGLLFERLFQFYRSFLHLVEEARVRDRNDSLVCEGGDQLDLRCREWSDLATEHPDYPEG